MGILTLEGLVSFLQQASQNTEKFRPNKNTDHCYNFKYFRPIMYSIEENEL